MPYLPVDLDAKRKADFVDKAHGLPRGSTIGGLLDAWEHVWRTKSDVLGELYASACFGADPKVRAALVEAEFLEPVDGGRWRVRGAAKWLFGMEGKKRGGQAAKGNLIPGARQMKAAQPRPAEKPEQPFSAPAESQPRASRDPLSAPHSALTASSQQPAAKLLPSEVVGAPPPDIEFFAWMQEARALAIPGVLPEVPPPNYKGWYPEAVNLTGGPDTGPPRLCAGYAAFLRDPWARALKPPCPVRVFIGNNKWRDYVPPEVRGAA